MKVPQSCPTLCSPIDCTSQGPLSMGLSGKNTRLGCHSLLQRMYPAQGSYPHLLCLLHWRVGSLPLAPSGKPTNTMKVNVKSLSRVRLCATPWTIAHQATPSMGFSRQEYWNGFGCHFLLQGIFPTQELNSGLLHYRQILYHLSHQGSPLSRKSTDKVIFRPS